MIVHFPQDKRRLSNSISKSTMFSTKKILLLLVIVLLVIPVADAWCAFPFHIIWRAPDIFRLQKNGNILQSAEDGAAAAGEEAGEDMGVSFQVFFYLPDLNKKVIILSECFCTGRGGYGGWGGYGRRWGGWGWGKRWALVAQLTHH